MPDVHCDLIQRGLVWSSLRSWPPARSIWRPCRRGISRKQTRCGARPLPAVPPCTDRGPPRPVGVFRAADAGEVELQVCSEEEGQAALKKLEADLAASELDAEKLAERMAPKVCLSPLDMLP